jgi:hypothetical protein
MNEDYQQKAKNFLQRNNLSLKIEYKETGLYFTGDKEERNIYNFTLRNKTTKKQYSAKFGDSINNTHNGNAPTQYDILACLNPYNFRDFEDFCSNFGYDNDSRQAEKTYKAVCKEYAGLKRVLNEDQRNQLNEIN